MFTGAITAIVTPFKDGKIDFAAFEKILEFQIKEGIDAVVPCGSTGESATMSHDEHKEFIKFTVDKTKGKVKVLAGTGSNNTAEAIELTQAAEKLGADGVLLISPYYNKPTQEGLYRHYKAIAENTSLPLVLYNVPGRTAKNMEASTVIRLANDFENVVAVKEASGDLDQMAAIIKDAPKDFNVISGDDALTLPLYALGGKGVISVLSNVAPAKVVKLCRLCEAGNFSEARKLHFELHSLFSAMFIETNPIPVKTAVGLMGFCSDELRLPLTPMEDKNKEKLKEVLKKGGLI
jgi:4-hydroxy-tetrahydrodipicolinate synthase